MLDMDKFLKSTNSSDLNNETSQDMAKLGEDTAGYFHGNAPG